MTVRSRFSRLALLLGLVGVLAAAIPTAAVSAVPGAPLAHLRLEVTTSSTWAIVRIDDGWILASETGASDNAAVSHNFSAVRVDRQDAAAPATATVDLVVDTTQTALHLANTDPVTVHLAKAGGGGSADLVVTNLNDPTAPAEVAHLVHPGPGSSPEQVAQLPAAEFFSTTDLALPRATDETRVIAAYYPWFSRSGDGHLTSYDDPTLGDTPQVRRDLDVAADVAKEVRQASRAGVDGFAVEYGSTHREEFHLVLEAAADAPRPFVVSGLLSAQLASRSNDPVGTMLQWMRDLDEEAAAAGDAFHRTPDGRPIAWVWGVSAFTPQQWSWFLGMARDEGLDLAIMSDGAPETYQDQFAGHFRYGLKQADTSTFSWWWARDAAYLRAQPLLDGTTPPLLVTTVSPGHDDCAVRQPCTVIDRDGGRRYMDTWQRAAAVDPDIVLVTSWNEWFESTSIAPSTDFGDRALRITSAWAWWLHLTS